MLTREQQREYKREWERHHRHQNYVSNYQKFNSKKLSEKEKQKMLLEKLRSEHEFGNEGKTYQEYLEAEKSKDSVYKNELNYRQKNPNDYLDGYHLKIQRSD